MIKSSPLPPGSTIGIVGGGQLGRMTALAAARLGYRCRIFTPETDSPAEQVADAATVASYEDAAALDAFADAVDVITFEFENIPAASVQRMAERKPVRPKPEILRVAQDRILEKTFVNKLGIATAPWRDVKDAEAMAAAVAAIGLPAVLKTARMGYDGKGQTKIMPGDDLAAAWRALRADAGVLESFIDLDREISVIVARGLDGKSVSYPAVENVHAHHILATTAAPAVLSPALAQQARETAEKIAAALDLIGLLAVEMFVTRDGRLLVNEIAPRPHNSGHWTIDACPVSQFEQLVRAVAGLPLGSVERHSDAIMTNLIGDDVHDWPRLAAEPGVCLHLYGKKQARAGRKMGHVTRLYPKGSLPGARARS